ncbi:MAG: radical SAM family heme chaperone HemW [Planctomycetes bacterium]|nr:radical SAM family heme chaperone HemW [Planctomycetota bacterium]
MERLPSDNADFPAGSGEGGGVAPIGGRAESLYVHVPFCVRKCGYCDFYSLGGADERLMAAYVEAVELEAARLPDARLRTIYVGGGTPTALPRALLERLLTAVRRRFDVERLEEFTVEANPGVLDEARLESMQACGVNRVSLGVQSFDPATLAALGRAHGAGEEGRAIELLRRRGVDNVSIDLMFAVPGQTMDRWLADLRAAVGTGVEHVSVYGLAIEPRTPLGRRAAAGEVAALADEVYAQMQMAAREVLTAAGYEHYELSNFARPGRRCRHNLTYWHNRAYLGLGPAAASYVGGVRATNVADVGEYVRRVRAGQCAAGESERLGNERRARETAMLGLRLLEGLDVAEFARTTGFDPLALFADAIRKHAGAGLVEVADGRIRLAPAALPVADSILSDFV